VRKYFDGYGEYDGVVVGVKYMNQHGNRRVHQHSEDEHGGRENELPYVYSIRYNDGDEEDVTEAEMRHLVAETCELQRDGSGRKRRGAGMLGTSKTKRRHFNAEKGEPLTALEIRAEEQRGKEMRRQQQQRKLGRVPLIDQGPEADADAAAAHGAAGVGAGGADLPVPGDHILYMPDRIYEAGVVKSEKATKLAVKLLVGKKGESSSPWGTVVHEKGKQGELDRWCNCVMESGERWCLKFATKARHEDVWRYGRLSGEQMHWHN
jgi:hypothetical protein